MPIEIEATILSQNFRDMKNIISAGYESLEPYNYVSFRVIHQMANMLQVEKPKIIYDPVELDSESLGSELIEAYK